MSSMSRHGGVKHRFTLIELLVVIAIIAILAAILLPALQSARRRGVASNCVSMRKQVGVWVFQYTEVYNGTMMPVYWGDNSATERWYSALAASNSKFKKSAAPITKWNRLDQYFGCPATSSQNITTPTKGSSITYNYRFGTPGTTVVKLAQIKTPSIKFIISDAIDGIYFSESNHVSKKVYASSNTSNRGFYPQHDNKKAGTMLYGDGHADLIRLSEMITIVSDTATLRRHYLPNYK